VTVSALNRPGLITTGTLSLSTPVKSKTVTMGLFAAESSTFGFVGLQATNSNDSVVIEMYFFIFIIVCLHEEQI
jgi:hypothetical protein